MIDISFHENDKDQYELSLSQYETWYSNDSIDITFDIDSFNSIGDKIIQILSTDVTAEDIPEKERIVEYQNHIFKKIKDNISVIKPINHARNERYFELDEYSTERDHILTALLVYKWYCDFQLDKATPNKLNTEIIIGYCFDLITELGRYVE